MTGQAQWGLTFTNAILDSSTSGVSRMSAAMQGSARETVVAVMLNGGRVTSGFREALFDAANRSGISVNEFVLQATAEKLRASGRQFSGVFQPGDISEAAV